MASHLNPSVETSELLKHARAATPFCSPEGVPFVSLPESIDSRNVVPLRSARFRDWVTSQYTAEHESPPSAGAIQAVVRALESDARYGDFPGQKVDLRVGFEGDPYFPSRVLVDLANASGELLEITAQGFTATSNLIHAFRRSPTTRPLPVDVSASEEMKRSSLDSFARLFSLNALSRARVLVWLAAALRPTGPYPILVLRGPTGSGKSLLARALRALVDPCSAPLRRLPARDCDVARVGFDNWAVVFDQVHRIPPNISSAISALSTGDSFEVRQPDRRDALTFELARPVILIAPSDAVARGWTASQSLASRTVTIDLDVISAPLPEAHVMTTLEALRPALTAALAAAVSTALSRLRDIEIGSVPRLADAAVWAAAAAPALYLAEADAVKALTDRCAIWSGSETVFWTEEMGL